MRYLIFIFVFISYVSWAQVKVVTPDEVKTIILQEEIEFIDIRTVEEFNEQYIEGAQNLIYDENFEENIHQLDPTKTIVVYCQTGKRSEECSKILQKNGFEKIIELEGGLDQWILEGKPTLTKLKEADD